MISSVFSAPVLLGYGQQASLEAAYATPQRAYHNFGHVQEVLRHYADVAAGPGWAQPVEIYLAVLYHDAIYESGRKDNEALSAALAAERLHGHVDAPRLARIVKMIEATAKLCHLLQPQR